MHLLAAAAALLQQRADSIGKQLAELPVQLASAVNFIVAGRTQRQRFAACLGRDRVVAGVP